MTDCELAYVEVEQGHFEEFKHTSIFQYFIIEGSGTFFLDDEAVPVTEGDLVQIKPGTRIWYKGKMRMTLVTEPAWTQEGETHIRTISQEEMDNA